MKNKTWFRIGAWSLLAVVLAVGLGFAQVPPVMYRHFMSKQDVMFATGNTGADETFTYTTPPGLVLTLTKIDASHLKFRTNLGTAKSVETLVDGSKTLTIKPLNIDAGGTLAIAGNSLLGGTLGVTGLTTFTAIPSCAVAPTTGSHLVNKTYADALVSTVPDATTSVKGIAELATNAECQSGTDPDRIVTPAGLAAVTATTARAGLAPLATAGEVLAGTEAAKTVTPATLAGFAKSLGASGYATEPGGLIKQWGSASFAAGTTTVTLPLAFPTAMVACNATWTENATTNRYSPKVHSFSTVSFVFRNTHSVTISANWVAYGY